MAHMVLVLVSVMISGNAFAGEAPAAFEKVDGEVIQDLFTNPKEVVDVAHSNSPACKKTCKLDRYLQSHLVALSREFSVATKAANKLAGKKKKAEETEVIDVPRTRWKGSCEAEPPKPIFETATKKLALLPEAERRTCCLSFNFEHGENVWSEELCYAKSTKTGVISGTFAAYGTP